MNNQIDFIEFKNLLNNYNILLFDGQYRIAHYKYQKIINSQNQNGGSNNFNQGKLNYDENKINKPFELINKINNHSENLLRIFISSLVDNNKNKINWVLESVSV